MDKKKLSALKHVNKQIIKKIEDLKSKIPAVEYKLAQ